MLLSSDSCKKVQIVKGKYLSSVICSLTALGLKGILTRVSAAGHLNRAHAREATDRDERAIPRTHNQLQLSGGFPQSKQSIVNSSPDLQRLE